MEIFLTDGGVIADAAADAEAPAAAVLIGNCPKIHEGRLTGAKNQIQGGGRAAGNIEVPRKIIAGAGGDISKDYPGCIGNALQGLVYCAVSSKHNDVDRVCLGGGHDILRDFWHIPGLVGEIAAKGDIAAV